MQFSSFVLGFCWFVAGAAPALAGPPLICRPIEIGSARSLPWTAANGWNGADPSYQLSRLVPDTLAVLTAGAPLDVRRETLRRAAIYSIERPGTAERLAAALEARVLDSEAAGRLDSDAWFDAGYFLGTLRQGARIFPALGLDGGDGAAWIHMAILLGGRDMEPSLALMRDH